MSWTGLILINTSNNRLAINTQMKGQTSHTTSEFEYTLPEYPHALDVDVVIEALQSTRDGLSDTEAARRLALAGPNTLPEPSQPGLAIILLRQFRDPMIYILLAAVVISFIVQHFSDAMFILVVLFINAAIGTAQEHSAQQSASSLRKLVTRVARVERGETLEIQALDLVPGDIVLLESGDKVPADLRLINCNALQVDESLLTGESLPVSKQSDIRLEQNTVIAERLNMAYSGTLVTHGRAVGIVVATGLATQIGKIAQAVLTQAHAKPPLLVRMEKFTFRLTLLLTVVIGIMGMVTLSRGTPVLEVLLMSAALAVAAIPEGLPVALTVALSIAMRRMAKRNVIARRLVTVEALGSCTYIATDKTGTLTLNELTARRLVLPGHAWISIGGEGTIPTGELSQGQIALSSLEQSAIQRLATSAVLNNEGFLGLRGDDWVHHGDAIDVALLVMAHKVGIKHPEIVTRYSERAFIPFESSNQFSATLNRMDSLTVAHVKGALERLLPMCSQMATVAGDVPIDVAGLESQAHELAGEGYRVLALASGEVELQQGEVFSAEHLQGLTLLGLVGMIDPLRPEAKTSIAECHRAGLSVAMITGDHPVTAFSIGRELQLVEVQHAVVSGRQLNAAKSMSDEQFDQLTLHTHVFARVEPNQKLDIVQSLQRNGHFVAVTGDGANDAPALRVAHVGVAMGKNGTDVARETADMIITDDNFASIVSGIEEGRIAYANVRKVIFLLISTGAGEIILFALSLIAGLPLPLTAVQLIWLNLVSNGIQDVALAFEPGEGNELDRPPRSPSEPIFNRLMIERVVSSALVIGVVAFLLFQFLLRRGMAVEDARNSLLLLMILFENVHVFNSRSETRSIFRHNVIRNPFLLFGTITAQLLHIAAMYTPGINTVLQIHPVSLGHWSLLLMLGVSALVVSEFYKLYRSHHPI